MLKSIFVIIGTIIGAGFASGQEIYSFFNIYEENGLIGILLSCVIIGIVIYKVLTLSNEKSISTYQELLEKIKIPVKIRLILNAIINIFLLISFYIMVAGFSAYFYQEFNIPKIITSIIIVILCYITFMRNIEGIAKVNAIIIPILILIVLALGIKVSTGNIIRNMDMDNIFPAFNWILKSIEYASYNSILLIPILISLKKYSNNNEKKISIISSGIFCVLSLIIYLLMFKINDINNIELPLVYIAGQYGSIFKITYSLVIVFAIYTTMISAGYGFLNNTTKNKVNYKKMALFICLSAIFISYFSFSELVNLAYPIFGVLGFFQIAYLVLIRT